MALPVLVVHGGAGSKSARFLDAAFSGVKNAVRAGYAVLSKGGNAVDAVQASVVVMEDDPTFNAGIGSVLTSDGDVEMDAAIMDGKTLKSGGVACIQNIKNPIVLARAVMDKTDHCLLAGQGAELFAVKVGLQKVPSEILISEESKHRYAMEHARRHGGCEHDTVGAVAVDAEGNIACATSTGGLSYKMPGRVGDSPVIGAGGYADNEVGGVSCTGHGESISKVVLAHHIINLMRQGVSAQEAADRALETMATRVHGYGGVIVLSKTGVVATSFNTEQMTWAYIQSDKLHYGIHQGEENIESVDS